MEEENSTNETCADKYDNDTINSLVYFRCVLVIVSAAFIAVMLFIIVLFKKYRFFTQRLVLYLAVSTLVYQVVSALDVTSVKAYSNKSALNYCIVIGFLTQVVIWWQFIATAVIVFDIFARVVLKKSTERLEIAYVLLIFGFSFLISWIPFVDSAYGPVQYFCWIRSEKKDCTGIYTNGIIMRLFLFQIPFYLLMLLTITFLIITATCLRKWRKSYIGKYDPNETLMKKKMEKEIRPMLYYPIVFIAALVTSFIVAIYTVVYPTENRISFIIVVVISSVIFRVQGVFITLVFALDPETRKKLNVQEITAAFKNFVRKDENFEYDAEFNVRSDSLHNTSTKHKSNKEEEKKTTAQSSL